MRIEQVFVFARAAQKSLERAAVGPPRVILNRVTHHLSITRRLYSSPSSAPTNTEITTRVSEISNILAAAAEPRVQNADPSLVSIKPQTQVVKLPRATVPTTCPGCGGLSQKEDKDQPGFYSKTRRAVKDYLSAQRSRLKELPVTFSIEGSQEEELQHDGETVVLSKTDLVETNVPTPICDRCHDLVYNAKGAKGTPIDHPSIQAIAESIAESPYDRNHIYHVLDAADFPMSLIPSIVNDLSLARPRSQNRRSQDQYTRRPTMSFIITRSDLLAPTKEKVDSLMTYFQATLRKALSRSDRSIRLGNVHLVSAKRGWWTKEIKDDIWERGGGSWMVGKFNVGKSNLFEVLFPKGSGERAPSYSELLRRQQEQMDSGINGGLLRESSLLPPAQPEEAFPTLPLVSSLPGTTASPIRLPFGNGKGELIDLPGLERAKLDQFVRPEHKIDIVMEHRPTVEQHTIKPGQSLLLGGGLIRLTPILDESDRSTTMQACAFVPIHSHVTSTEKAVGLESRERESNIKSIVTPTAGPALRSAGVLKLTTDVTKQRAGPVVRAGVSLASLPFRIFATDVLIEGVGWVEMACQVRRRRPRHQVSYPAAENDQLRTETISEDGGFQPFGSHARDPVDNNAEAEFPSVEVFSPNGASIAQRECMGAWTLWQAGAGRRRREAAARPRKSMKGSK